MVTISYTRRPLPRLHLFSAGARAAEAAIPRSPSLPVSPLGRRLHPAGPHAPAVKQRGRRPPKPSSRTPPGPTADPPRSRSPSHTGNSPPPASPNKLVNVNDPDRPLDPEHAGRTCPLSSVVPGIMPVRRSTAPATWSPTAPTEPTEPTAWTRPVASATIGPAACDQAAAAATTRNAPCRWSSYDHRPGPMRPQERPSGATIRPTS
jgi:hypothetical protein